METTNTTPAKSQCPYCPPAPSLSNAATPKLQDTPPSNPSIRHSSFDIHPSPSSPLRPFPIASSLTFADLAQLPAPAQSSLSTARSPLLSSYLPPGQLTLLLAHPSTGKSLLTLHLAASLSRGLDPFSGAGAPTGIPSTSPTNPGWKSGALASQTQNGSPAVGTPLTAPAQLPLNQPSSPQSKIENPKSKIPIESLLLTADSPHLTILPRLKRLNADLTKIHLLAHFHSLVSLTKPTKQNPNPLRPLQLLEEFLDSHPHVRLIILDPILKFLGHHAARKDLTQITEPTSLLEKLMQLAEDRHITILATATLPNLNLSNIDSALAQNHLTRTIPNILLLAKDPRPMSNDECPMSNQSQNPNVQTNSAAPVSSFEHSNLIRHSSFDIRHSTRLLLLHLKSPTALLPTIPLTLIDGIPTFSPLPQSKIENRNSKIPPDPYADWYSETTSLTPRDLHSLIRAHRPPSPAIAHAMTFLKEYLNDSGPIPFTKLAKDLAPNALAESTVREASRILGVIKAPNLFQKNWVWHLKDDLRPFPGDPKINPFTQQAHERAKEQAFHAQQEKRRLAFAAQMMERESPDSPSSPSAQPKPTRPEQAKASGAQASACQTPQVQQNKPPYPNSTPVPAPFQAVPSAQPPRPPIPLGPISP